MLSASSAADPQAHTMPNNKQGSKACFKYFKENLAVHGYPWTLSILRIVQVVQLCKLPSKLLCACPFPPHVCHCPPGLFLSTCSSLTVCNAAIPCSAVACSRRPLQPSVLPPPMQTCAQRGPDSRCFPVLRCALLGRPRQSSQSSGSAWLDRQCCHVLLPVG